ncbi:hypothetical protein CVT26_002505 [Gymnopilus dilepis]|uniref:Uncharacterized protein n=1 Tax=Gymnopilus dilepis TaxID=231916 RepID=A0A409YX14_9AGAR|nr:hypothetical protein CVT26_002505 [Gymnopilus dilepis]
MKKEPEMGPPIRLWTPSTSATRFATHLSCQSKSKVWFFVVEMATPVTRLLCRPAPQTTMPTSSTYESCSPAALTCKHKSMVGSVPHHHLAATSLAPKRKPEVCFSTRFRFPCPYPLLALIFACQSKPEETVDATSVSRLPGLRRQFNDDGDDEEFKPGSILDLGIFSVDNFSPFPLCTLDCRLPM